MLFLKPGETGVIFVSQVSFVGAPNSWDITGANTAQGFNGDTNNGFKVSYSATPPVGFAIVAVPANAHEGVCDLNVRTADNPPIPTPVYQYECPFQVSSNPPKKSPTCEPCKTAPKGDQAPDCACKGEGKVLAY